MSNERYEKNNNRQQIVETFEKKFDVFSEGIKALGELHPYIGAIFGVEEGKKLSPYDAAGIMADELNAHFPDIEYGKNTRWSLNLSSTRCILKTSDRISFGWKLKYNYDRVNHITTITEVTIVITAFGTDVLNNQRTLTEDGWVKTSDANRR